VVGFLAAVRTCFSKYVTFSGRARRPEYWWFVLAGALFGLVATLLDVLLGTGTTDGGLFASLVSLGLLFPTLAVTWRRLHDVDKPGWFVFIGLLAILPMLAATLVVMRQGEPGGMLVPGLFGLGGLVAAGAWIYLLVLLVSRGTAGPNRFGPEPQPPHRPA
jgi:uncharacterized membrane protein YhaH (DUF805 family)